MFGFFKRRREATERARQVEVERFRDRQASPRFELVAARYGAPISQPLRDLYLNTGEIQRDSVSKIIPGKPSDQWLYFCWYVPLDAESLGQQVGPDPKLLEFADDGSGSRYAVNPTDPNAAILYL